MQEQLLNQLSMITKEEEDILMGKTQIQKSIYTTNADFIVDEKCMLDRGKVIDIRTHTRFVHFPRHRHNYIEIIYMCSGSTTHMINGREEILLKKGELLFLSQNAAHEISPAGINDVAVNFIVVPEFFPVVFQAIEEENIIHNFLISTMQQKKREMDYMYFRVSDILPVQNLIENMIWSLLTKQKNQRNIFQTTMGLLILELANCTERITQNQTKQFEQGMMFTVWNYIEQHYKNGTLTELASILNQSITGLSRFIKQQTGFTFQQLMQQERLKQSVFLLKTTKLTIEDIMIAIGYDNSSYFHRIFREKYGITPKKYRNETVDC